MVETSKRNIGQKLLDLYLYGSFHIGLMALSFTLFGYAIFGVEYNFVYIYCIFFSTVALYSLHRFVGISKVEQFAKEGRFRIIKLYKHHITSYFVLASVVSLGLFLNLPFDLQALLFGFGIVCLAYAVPIIRGKRIRDFDYIKIGLIAIVWTFLCITIPGILGGAPVFEIEMYSLASILFFIGLTLPFDIRDLDIDKSINVKTFASLWGVNKGLKMARLLIVVSFSLMLFKGLFTHYTVGIVSWMIVCLLTLLILHFFNSKRDDWYYSLVLDGMIGMFFLVFILTKYLINSFIY